ncbi:PIN domain-containing protein [candidate division KSB1 bacterium]|nr:PIN domain-containing protein [candidate division KSB1 bacterium]
MTFKVFIDSDIILDVLAKREPFYEPAALLFSLIEKGKLAGYTSPVIFSNIYYVLHKRVSKKITTESLRYLKTLIQILPLDNRAIELALDSEFNDFEDAIQYFCAEQNSINYIITRNKIDYKKAKINILTAKEFLAMLKTISNN